MYVSIGISVSIYLYIYIYIYIHTHTHINIYAYITSYILTLPRAHRRQVLLYDSVDSYIADCALAPDEVMAHICSAMDYKDNDKLLEDYVNHMASNTLRADGICIKLVTRTGETAPGVYIEDRNLQVLHTMMLDAEFESHFANRCGECTV